MKSLSLLIGLTILQYEYGHASNLPDDTIAIRKLLSADETVAAPGDGAPQLRTERIRMHDKAMCYKVDGTWKILRFMSEDVNAQDFQSLMDTDIERYEKSTTKAYETRSTYYSERTINGKDPVLVRSGPTYPGHGGSYYLQRYNAKAGTWEGLGKYVSGRDERFFSTGNTKAHKVTGTNGRFQGMETVYNTDGLDEHDIHWIESGFLD